MSDVTDPPEDEQDDNDDEQADDKAIDLGYDSDINKRSRDPED